ncbi:MAG: B12-binding domain-containing radical SAM protein [Deltaproteobacteria bacterium]|nr:B12-binding domain-containing radical SAM protein [Deltaproteobacteria bacterium]
MRDVVSGKPMQGPRRPTRRRSPATLFVQLFDRHDAFSYYSPAIATLAAVLGRAGFRSRLHAADVRDPDRLVVEAARRSRAAVVAFSILSPSWPHARRLIRAVKEGTRALVIAGGPHPTFCPEEVLAQSPVDAICLGEGETALLELVRRLAAGRRLLDVRNFWFRDPDGGRRIVRNPLRPLVADLDGIPDQDRGLFRRAERRTGVPREDWRMIVQAGRGCLFDCSFCANEGMGALYGGCRAFHRVRGPARVVGEIAALVRRHPGREIYFSDEVFPLAGGWFAEFADGMRRIGSPRFSVLARCEVITPERVRRLREAGCIRVAMGVEHGNERYRREMLGKRLGDAVIRRAFAAAKAAGLLTQAFCMVGLPFETDELVEETMRFLPSLGPDATTCQVFNPLPGSRLHELCRRRGLLPVLEPDQDRPDMLHLIRHVSLSPAKLAEACRFFRIPGLERAAAGS